MEYQLEEPIDVIFSAIEDLQELEELAGRSFTSYQIVDIGYLIMSKHRIFRSDMQKWLRRAAFDQTWPELKTFFLEIHQELRDTDTLVNDLDYRSASAIVE